MVGIQVREQDSHIWDALASTDAAIHYCSGSRGAKTFQDWQGRMRSGRAASDTVSTGYWDDEFDEIRIRLLPEGLFSATVKIVQ